MFSIVYIRYHYWNLNRLLMAEWVSIICGNSHWTVGQSDFSLIHEWKRHGGSFLRYYWVNHSNSLTWIEAIKGDDFPKRKRNTIISIPVRSQWGPNSVPRYMYLWTAIRKCTHTFVYIYRYVYYTYVDI